MPNNEKSNEPIQPSQQNRSTVTNSANKTEDKAPISFWLKENKAPNSNKTELTSESNKDQQDINKQKVKRKQGALCIYENKRPIKTKKDKASPTGKDLA